MVFGLTYLIGFPATLLLESLFRENFPVFMEYLSRIPVVIMPTLAAVLVIGLREGAGKRTIQGILHRLRPRRALWCWYWLLPLGFMVIHIAALLVCGMPMRQFSELLAVGWPWLMLHLVLQILIIGVGEEIGWRGFLLPALMQKYKLLVAIGLVSVCWMAWHLPVFFSGIDRWLPFIGLNLGASLMLAWIYLQTRGNLSVLAVAHGSMNAPLFFLENQLRPDLAWLIRDSQIASGMLFLVGGLYCLGLICLKLRVGEIPHGEVLPQESPVNNPGTANQDNQNRQ